MPESRPLNRSEKIRLILKLQENCKSGIAIQDEFTIGKYDFLLSEGKCSISPDVRDHYYQQALNEYIYELEDMRHSGTLVEGYSASEAIIRIMKGIITFEQTRYINNKMKVIYLKDFLTHSETLKFDV